MKLNGLFLNVFDDISNWFFRVTSNITFKGQVIPFLFGIVFGIIIFGLMYVLFVFATFKKNEKKSKGYVEISDEKILQIIQNSKNKFLEESSMKPLSEKYQDVVKISWEVICDIASTIYPDSKHPLFELTSNEFLLLIHYISDRVDELLSGRVFRKLREFKVSDIIKYYDAKKTIEETKAVKAAKQSGVMKVIGPILNTINPFYWFRKAIVNIAIVKITNKLALDIIDIVGEETTKVYTKEVFKIEGVDNLEQIERILNEEEKK